jgi:hypothetical protein
MQLPKLNCVFFDDFFPVEIKSMQEYTHQMKRETELVLHLLAHRATEEDRSIMSAKLDLILLHTLQHAYPKQPTFQMCRLGLDAVIIPSSSTPHLGDALLMTLCTEVKDNFVVHIPIMVSNTSEGSIEGHLTFTQAQTQYNWEQWIFQRHRQSIQQHQTKEKLEMST